MRNLYFLTLLSIILFSCNNDDDVKTIPAEPLITGYMYTSTNANGQNAVLGFKQFIDGTIEELENSPFFTKDLGATEQGDFDAQYSIRMIDDLLLVVNAGKNPVNGTISVFKIDKPSGNLTLIDQTPSDDSSFNIDSRGIRPVSIAITETNDKTWVVVGNQHSIFGYAGANEIPFGELVNTNERNIVLYSLDKDTGLLTFETILDTYFDGNIGGVACVDFNENGSKLIVSTLGIIHIDIDFPNPNLLKSSQIYFYDFNNGSATNTGIFAEPGVAGTVAAIWSNTGNNIYTTSFNLTEDRIDYDVLRINSNNLDIEQNFRSGLELDNSSCWATITEDKQHLLTVNLGENSVASYKVAADDALSIVADPYITPARDLNGRELKDIINLGNYVYAISAVNSHKISIFYLNSDGSLTELSSSPYAIPSSIGKTSEQEIFLGLVGYSK
ncbi:lactonase family protein [Aureivirga marina]|uniref:hypothetical protein n=1 Tax=Aureivirga marina TaxID=1182451 RepID=UPI0018CA4ECB|nr:hypothetical protein [Aureivirga marina]